MTRTLAIAAAFIAFAASPAAAHHCPKDAKAIDAALGKVTLSAADKKAVMALKAKGMALHKAGKHHDSEHALSEAARLLMTKMK